MNLTEHFTLEELTHSDIGARLGLDNTPSDAEIENLKRLATLLEQIRALLGKPVMVNSAFRSKAVNDAVGSKDTSQHRVGCAADIRVQGMSPNDVCKAIIASDLHYDQIIREFDSWTHISVPNKPNELYRYSKLIIDKTGIRAYS